MDISSYPIGKNEWPISQTEKITQEEACFFLNRDGVRPVNFLKAVLNADKELNPTSKAIAAMERCLLLGFINCFSASCIR